jgi:hypothetical protein
METLLGLALAGSPFVLMGSLLVLRNRRERRREATVTRQIALTNALHARLGAVVAPVIRRRGSRWQVAIAVPLDRPAVVACVVGIVDQFFAGSESADYEMVLSQQSAGVRASTAAVPAARTTLPLRAA